MKKIFTVACILLLINVFVILNKQDSVYSQSQPVDNFGWNDIPLRLLGEAGDGVISMSTILRYRCGDIPSHLTEYCAFGSNCPTGSFCSSIFLGTSDSCACVSCDLGCAPIGRFVGEQCPSGTQLADGIVNGNREDAACCCTPPPPPTTSTSGAPATLPVLEPAPVPAVPAPVPPAPVE